MQLQRVTITTGEGISIFFIPCQLDSFTGLCSINKVLKSTLLCLHPSIHGFVEYLMHFYQGDMTISGFDAN